MGSTGFNKKILLRFFVMQMPKEYNAVRDTLFSRKKLKRKDILSNLHNKQESLRRSGGSSRTEQLDAAN